MKKLTLILLTILLFSCTTAPDGKLFPLTPTPVILQNDSLLNEIMLAENIIEWRIRDIKIKYILGMITEEQYKIWFDKYMSDMRKIDQAYELYYRSKE